MFFTSDWCNRIKLGPEPRALYALYPPGEDEYLEYREKLDKVKLDIATVWFALPRETIRRESFTKDLRLYLKSAPGRPSTP